MQTKAAQASKDRRGAMMAPLLVAVAVAAIAIIPIARWFIAFSHGTENINEQLAMQSIIQEYYSKVSAASYEEIKATIEAKGTTWTENIGGRYTLTVEVSDPGKFENAICNLDEAAGAYDRVCRKVNITLVSNADPARMTGVQVTRVATLNQFAELADKIEAETARFNDYYTKTQADANYACPLNYKLVSSKCVYCATPSGWKQYRDSSCALRTCSTGYKANSSHTGCTQITCPEGQELDGDTCKDKQPEWNCTGMITNNYQIYSNDRTGDCALYFGTGRFPMYYSVPTEIVVSYNRSFCYGQTNPVSGPIQLTGPIQIRQGEEVKKEIGEGETLAFHPALYVNYNDETRAKQLQICFPNNICAGQMYGGKICCPNSQVSNKFVNFDRCLPPANIVQLRICSYQYGSAGSAYESLTCGGGTAFYANGKLVATYDAAFPCGTSVSGGCKVGNKVYKVNSTSNQTMHYEFNGGNWDMVLYYDECGTMALNQLSTTCAHVSGTDQQREYVGNKTYSPKTN